MPRSSRPRTRSAFRPPYRRRDGRRAGCRAVDGHGRGARRTGEETGRRGAQTLRQGVPRHGDLGQTLLRRQPVFRLCDGGIQGYPSGGYAPNSIGKFGGDTDNWMWPRHTGDFSMFRIYAGKDNRPAEYSTKNVPYRADEYLRISLDGYDEGDFAMIMGFPGSTQRYMTSYEIDRMLTITNPQRIFIRGERQKIPGRRHARERQGAHQYASEIRPVVELLEECHGDVARHRTARREAQEAGGTRLPAMGRGEQRRRGSVTTRRWG